MDARLLLLAAATTLVGGVRGIIAAEPSTALQSRVAPVQRAALPANLFHLDDNAIIIIGGRPIRAGVAKSEIRAQLAQASGPPQLLRAPRRNVKVVPQVTAALGSAAPARVMDGIANGGPPPRPRGALPAAGTPVSAELFASNAPPPSRGALHPQPVPITSMTCDSTGPLIGRLSGAAISGASFDIDGACFGDSAGGIELIGQFPGGTLRPAFSAWSDQHITVVMPAVRGVLDQTVALTVVTASHRPTAAQPIAFVAAREEVEVPVGDWTPGGDVDVTDVYQSSSVPFLGGTVSGIAPPAVAHYSLQVGPQCALDTMQIPATVGRVVSLSGWTDPGPPNVANITVDYAPMCTIQTNDFVVASNSTMWCRIAYQLRAQAFCPAGTTP
jgi:hypothetical protein